MSISEQLIARLERLERVHRRDRCLLALAVATLVLIPLLSMAQDGGVPEVIQARSFEVVDEVGRPLVHLFGADGVGAIGTSDAEGNPLAVLVAEKTGDRVAGKLTLLDNTGAKRASMAASPEGPGVVTTYGSDGEPLVVLDGSGGRGSVTTFDEDGSTLVSISSGPTGHGVVRAHNGDGNERALFGVSSSGHGTLATSTGPGRIAVELGGHKDGGFVHVNNYAGTPVCALDVNMLGHGLITVTDRQGDRKVITAK